MMWIEEVIFLSCVRIKSWEDEGYNKSLRKWSFFYWIGIPFQLLKKYDNVYMILGGMAI